MINNENNSQTTNEELFYGKAEDVNVEAQGDKKVVDSTTSDQEAKSTVDKAESEESKDESKATDADKEVGLKAEDLKANEAVFNKDELNLFVEKAKELGLSKEQAQAYLDDKIAERASAEANIKTQVDELHKKWLDTVKADPEIGGAKLTESAEMAKRAVEQFGSDALKSFLDETGLGNHPEMIRAFANIGKKLANDKFISGQQVSKPTEVPAHKLFYPDKT